MTVTTITLRTTLTLSLLAAAVTAVAAEPTDSVATDSTPPVTSARSQSRQRMSTR